jgi:ASC-1-like (ASCH) protein
MRITTATAQFVSLSTCKKEAYPIVEKAYIGTHGNRDEVLEDIKARGSRKTEILQNNGRNIGCIVYEREKADSEEMENCFRVSLASIFEWAYRDHFPSLVERIEEVAKSMRANYISYLIPATQQDAISFFTKHSFFAKKIDADQVQLTKDIRRVSEEKIKDSHSFKRERDDDRQVPDSDERKQHKPEPKRTNSQTQIHLGHNSHQLTLKKPFIAPIRSGIKTIEGRINSGAPSKFKVGDKLRFFYPQDERDDVTCEITKIEKFNGFKEMLEATGYQKCIPGARSLQEAAHVYDSIPGYTDRARQNGVIAIHLKKQ